MSILRPNTEQLVKYRLNARSQIPSERRDLEREAALSELKDIILPKLDLSINSNSHRLFVGSSVSAVDVAYYQELVQLMALDSKIEEILEDVPYLRVW